MYIYTQTHIHTGVYEREGKREPLYGIWFSRLTVIFNHRKSLLRGARNWGDYISSAVGPQCIRTVQGNIVWGRVVRRCSSKHGGWEAVSGGRKAQSTPFENTWERMGEHPGILKGRGPRKTTLKPINYEDRWHGTAQIWMLLVAIYRRKK